MTMDTRRLILLMIFSFSLVMLWEGWQRQNQPPATGNAQATTPTVSTTPAVSAEMKGLLPTPTATAGAPASVPTPVSGSVKTAETVTVRTDLFVAEFSTLGAELIRLELTGHKANADKTAPMVLVDPAHRYAVQSGLIGEGLPNHRTVFTLLPGPRQLGDNQTLDLSFEATTTSGVKLVKTYTFARGKYLITLTQRIDNHSTQALDAHAYYQFQRDDRSPEGESSMINTFTGPAVYTEAQKYQKVSFSDIESKSAKFVKQANDGWLAMIQHYFVAAWLPAAQTPREYYMRAVGEGAYAAGVIVPTPSVAPGASASQTMPLYLGPQTHATLVKLAPGLDLVVDYGWLTVVAAPLFWLLNMIHDQVGNWGWAIILLTVLIKAVFFPLSAASYRSMARMRKMTPRLTQLKERYGDDRQKLNQEMMELYRKEKINPLGGCLPIVIQIPVFIALYWVLLGAVEMRGAPWWLWINDLSAQDPYYVLPVLMVVSMLIQTRLNPTPPDPIQAKLMMAMPFIFGAMFFFFPAGLVLYWVVNNILSIAQQWQITRLIESGKPG
jgi:YidC/Oxa1 family membrane protein insertase